MMKKVIASLLVLIFILGMLNIFLLSENRDLTRRININMGSLRLFAGEIFEECWYNACFNGECKGFKTYNITDPLDNKKRGQCEVLKEICEVRNNTNYINYCRWYEDENGINICECEYDTTQFMM